MSHTPEQYEPTNDDNGRWKPKQFRWGYLEVAITVNMGCIIAIVIYLFGATFAAGEKNRQIDINTQKIHDLDIYGTQALQGVQQRLNGVDVRLNELHQEDRDLRQFVETQLKNR